MVSYAHHLLLHYLKRQTGPTTLAHSPLPDTEQKTAAPPSPCPSSYPPLTSKQASSIQPASSITPLARKPVLYLSAEEEGDDKWFADRGIPDRYWLINAGHKSDYTVKFWGRSNYQRLVDLTRHRINWVQVGAKDAGHTHRPLDGVIDMIGKTSHRDLVRLAYRADGAVTGMSYLMHLAAIRWRGHGNSVRPCVVIAGGREPDAFTMYPGQHRFSSVGLLPCCSNGGCWKSRTGEDCTNVVKADGETVPACMARIHPEDVAQRVLELDALQDAM